MNKCQLLGRLTREPDIRYAQTQNGVQTCVARYTLAVNRRNQQQEQTADFISIVAFGKAGEFAENYLHQGTKIIVCGRIQTGSYTNKDGQRVYTTEVIAEEQEFAESAQHAQQAPQQPPQMQQAPQQAPQQQNRGRGQQRQQQAPPQPQPAPNYDDEWMHIQQGLENDLPFR